MREIRTSNLIQLELKFKGTRFPSSPQSRPMTGFKTPVTFRGNYCQKMVIFKIQGTCSKDKFSRPKFIVDFEN